MRNIIDRFRELLGERKRLSLTSFLDSYIADCESGKRLHQRKKTRLADGTINTFRNLRVALRDYEAQRKQQISLNDITPKFIDSFTVFLFQERIYQDGKKRTITPNTCYTYVTALKTLINIAIQEGLRQNNTYKYSSFNIERGSAESIYLTEKQVNDLFLTDFTDSSTLKIMIERIENKEERAKFQKRLMTVRQKKRHRQYYQEYKDLFVVGCLTGQRHSDYKRINTAMIKETDGFKFIDITQQKTGKRVLIPLDARVEEILRRYGGRITPHGINSMTKGLKDIGLLMGWTHNAGIKEYVGTEKRPSNKRFCDLITTHTARRTWATNAYKNHVPLSSIMAVTGHTSESMLRKYLRLNEEEKGLNAARDLLKSGYLILAPKKPIFT
jgi:integrase